MSLGPTDAQLIELHDRLWNDPRRRDDRAEFFECEHCGSPVRWVANIGSQRRSSLQIVARCVATAALFDPGAHAGMIAVFTDRTGFTVSRFTQADDIEGAFLYRCHWDVCGDARRIRDRIHRERYGAPTPDLGTEPDPDVVDRYAAWRRELN